MAMIHTPRPEDLRFAQVPRGVHGQYEGRAGGRPSGSSDDGPGWEQQIDGSAFAARTVKLGWVAPVLLLLVGLFIQNGGLYLGTVIYVRWMDELAEPPSSDSQDFHQESTADSVAAAASHVASSKGRPLQDYLTLADPLEDFLRSFWSQPTNSHQGDPTWPLEAFIDCLSSILVLIWLAWVVRTSDLRLWTRSLLTISLLAALKGFLAWATVLPDAAGWSGCSKRLGRDGLMYYREVGAAMDKGQGTFQAIQDILLLELHGLCSMGNSGRQRVCADTMFSMPTSFCALIAISVYDALRASKLINVGSRLETARGLAARQSMILALVGAALCSICIGEVALMVSSPHHYTLDIAVALPLTLLVYGTPAVALAAESWAQMCLVDPEAFQPLPHGEESELQAPLAAGSPPPSPVSLPLPDDLAPSINPPIGDLGIITIPPCAVPCCAVGGLYYMRDEPSSSQSQPWNEEAQRMYERQVQELLKLVEPDAGRIRQLEEALEEERRRSKVRAGEASARVDAAIRQKEKDLATEEETVLTEAKRRSDEQRKIAVSTAEEALASLTALSARGKSIGEERARLTGEVERYRTLRAEAQRDAAEESLSAEKRAGQLETLRTLLASHPMTNGKS